GIIPTSIFRKRVLVCCACYLLHTPTERRYLLRVPLILDAKKDCSRHALQSPDFSYCEVNPLLFRLPLSPLLLRLQSVCLYRSYRPAARQAAAARWISPHCCSGRKIDLPKYDTGLQGHRIPVNSAVVPCSRYSQGQPPVCKGDYRQPGKPDEVAGRFSRLYGGEISRLGAWGECQQDRPEAYPHPAFQTGGFPLQTGQSH